MLPIPSLQSVALLCTEDYKDRPFVTEQNKDIFHAAARSMFGPDDLFPKLLIGKGQDIAAPRALGYYETEVIMENTLFHRLFPTAVVPPKAEIAKMYTAGNDFHTHFLNRNPSALVVQLAFSEIIRFPIHGTNVSRTYYRDNIIYEYQTETNTHVPYFVHSFFRCTAQGFVRTHWAFASPFRIIPEVSGTHNTYTRGPLYKLTRSTVFVYMTPYIRKASNVIETCAPLNGEGDVEDMLHYVRDLRQPVYLYGPDEGYPYRRA